MKICVIIPTLNEEKNIFTIYSKIRKNKKKFDIYSLTIFKWQDTKNNKNFKKTDKKIKTIFRQKKLGIGSAHKEGFKFAYEKKYDLIITLDSDGTHNPKYFNKMIQMASSYDYILTSRFKKPGLIDDWPLSENY